ncbi:MAG TPA: Crp/Fnr family transcriptional regulator [Chitinophagaceae bacterium]|nr:Crp/Fnr family transcriptional regulator [Chitinophagaceae bacterium]
MKTDKLIAFLKNIVSINENDISLLDASFEKITTKRNEVFVEYGKTAKDMYFVLSGFVRVFHFEKGVEITNHLASENFFVTAYYSFTTKTSSEEVVQTITECELLKITKENLDALYKQSHNIALFGLLMSERYLVFNNQRAKDLITLNSEEKYLKLIKEEPHILQNVPLQYISSYIGIEPQTLSRIRRKIIT